MDKDNVSQEEYAAKLRALEIENQELRKKVPANSSTGRVIVGSIEVSLETPEGKTVKKKVTFQPGFVRARLKGGDVVSSQALMDLANGKKLSEEDTAASPALAGKTKQDAINIFTNWARIRAGFLVEA